MLTNFMKKSPRGNMLFSGDMKLFNVFQATVLIAENCPSFQMDVEDEVIFEEKTTCYNCRYRRWLADGFSCYKEFPNLQYAN